MLLFLHPGRSEKRSIDRSIGLAKDVVDDAGGGSGRRLNATVKNDGTLPRERTRAFIVRDSNSPVPWSISPLVCPFSFLFLFSALPYTGREHSALRREFIEFLSVLTRVHPNVRGRSINLI